MKMIRAIVRPEMVDKVLDELQDAGHSSVTKIDVVGRGKQRGVKVGNVHYDQLPKELLLIVCEDENCDEITSLITKNARTGEGTFGDGKIFISEVEKAVTISSGEEVL
jgi:nitrogen regulatory protein PII 1